MSGLGGMNNAPRIVGKARSRVAGAAKVVVDVSTTRPTVSI